MAGVGIRVRSSAAFYVIATGAAGALLRRVRFARLSITSAAVWAIFAATIGAVLLVTAAWHPESSDTFSKGV